MKIKVKREGKGKKIVAWMMVACFIASLVLAVATASAVASSSYTYQEGDFIYTVNSESGEVTHIELYQSWFDRFLSFLSVTPPVTCTSAEHFSSGCKLLLHYDANGDGVISGEQLPDGTVTGEIGQAVSDWMEGGPYFEEEILTTTELMFVIDALNLGSVNAKCPECYGVAPPPTPDPNPPSWLSWLQNLWSWITSYFFAITGAEEVTAGTSLAYDVSLTTYTVDSDWSDGSYEQLWGSWILVDGSKNTKAGGSWTKMTGKIYSTTASFTAPATPGTYYLVSTIVNQGWEFAGGQWVKMSEVAAAKEAKKITVMPAVTPELNPFIKEVYLRFFDQPYIYLYKDGVKYTPTIVDPNIDQFVYHGVIVGNSGDEVISEVRVHVYVDGTELYYLGGTEHIAPGQYKSFKEWALYAVPNHLQPGTHTIRWVLDARLSSLTGYQVYVDESTTYTIPAPQDPCAGVVCDNYCLGSTLYHSGYCSGGSCIYSSESCNYGCTAGACNPAPEDEQPSWVIWISNLWDWLKGLFGV